MKKLTAIVLCLILVLSAMPVFAADGEWTGSGTEADPYVISDAADLEKLAADVDGGEAYAGTYFKLGADINLEGYSFNIGEKNWDENIAAFSGHFDGDGYKVYNYNYTADTCAALFGYVVGTDSDHATISNLTVEGNVSGQKWVAGIVGYGQFVDITNCINYANATNNTWEFVAGIAGQITQSTITNCVNYGYIDASQSKFTAAGIAAIANLTYIYDCINYGTINLSSPSTSGNQYRGAGGIVGFGESNVHIYRCMNTGDIVAESINGALQYIGGIAGIVKWEFTASGCLNSGDIVDNHTVNNCDTGGIVGRVVNGKAGGGWSNIYDCINLGNGGNAGLIGSFDSYASVYNCYVDSTNNSDVYGWINNNTYTANNYSVDDADEKAYADRYTLLNSETVLSDTVTNLLKAGDHHGTDDPWVEVNGEPALKHHVEAAVTIDSAYNTYVRFNVNPANLASQTVIVALYNGDELVGMQKKTVNDMRADFANVANATSAKVFVWDSLAGAKPLTVAAELSL